MNYTSYFLVVILIFVLQYIVDLAINIKKNQERLMENFSLSGKPYDGKAENEELSDKHKFWKSFDYSNFKQNNDKKRIPRIHHSP